MDDNPTNRGRSINKMEGRLGEEIVPNAFFPSRDTPKSGLDITSEDDDLDTEELTPIEVLNLSCEKKLIAGGIRTVQQLKDWMQNDFRPSIEYVGGGKIGAIKKALMDFDPQVKIRTVEIDITTPVEAFKFSFVGALKSGGIDTLGNLFEWFRRGFEPKIKGIGKGKRLEISDTLRRIRILDSGITVSKGARHELSPLYSKIPTKYFHFGVRSSHLSDSIGASLGELGEWFDKGCYPVKNFGRGSTTKARKILSSLYQSLNDQGIPNWDEFCALASIRIIPSEKSLLQKESVLETIPIIINEVIEAINDDIEADILRNRLVALRSQQETLRELADRHGVTRERIRQKESNLIEGISAGLIDEYYVDSKFRFRSELALMWQLASEAFGEAKELDSEKFLGTLSELWGAPIKSLVPHLSFIFAVLTRCPKVPECFLLIQRYPNLFGGNLPEILTCKSIHEIPLCWSMAKWIEEVEVATVGEILLVIRGMPLGHVRDSIHKWLEPLESYLRNLACFDNFSWQQFFKVNGQVVLPEESIANIGVFFERFEDSLRKIVRAGSFNRYSCEVLENCFAASNKRGLTLPQLRRQLSGLQSDFYRSQKLMFQRFRLLFVDRKFTKSKIVISESFSSYWKQIDNCYKVGDSIEDFILKLKNKWSNESRVIDKYGELIWKIITSQISKRVSAGRNSKKTKNPSYDCDSIPKNFVVVLRKKRTVH